MASKVAGGGEDVEGCVEGVEGDGSLMLG